MVERQAHTPEWIKHGPIERTTNGNGNGFHKTSETIFSSEQEGKILLNIVTEHTGVDASQLPMDVLRTLVTVDKLNYPPKEPKIPEVFTHLSINDKFKIAGHAFWQEGKNFELVKKYLGEDAGPKWEDILNHVWERNDLVAVYDDYEHQRKFIDEFTKTSSGDNFLKILKYIEVAESKGISHDTLLQNRDEVMEVLQPYLRIRRRKNTDDITAEKNLYPPFPLITKVLVRRKKHRTVEQISKELNLSPARVKRINSALIYLEKIKPIKAKEKESEEFRVLLKKVEQLSNENPELQNEDFSRILNVSYPNIKYARMVLLEAGRVENLTKYKYLHRKPEIVAAEKKVIELRTKYPRMSYPRIAKKVGITEEQVQYYMKNGIDKGEIQKWKELRKDAVEKKLRQRIRKHLRENPKLPFALAPLQREFRTSHETLTLVFNRIASEYPKLIRAGRGYSYINSRRTAENTKARNELGESFKRKHTGHSFTSEEARAVALKTWARRKSAQVNS